MTQFIVKLSLENAGEKDYKNLQHELEKEAFTGIKIMPGKQGSYYRKGREYIKKGNFTLIDLTDIVFKAADKTGKKYSFIIIKDKLN